MFRYFLHKFKINCSNLIEGKFVSLNKKEPKGHFVQVLVAMFHVKETNAYFSIFLTAQGKGRLRLFLAASVYVGMDRLHFLDERGRVVFLEREKSGLAFAIRSVSKLQLPSVEGLEQMLTPTQSYRSTTHAEVVIISAGW